MSKQMPVLLEPQQARVAAQALAGARLLIGVVALVSPAVALKPWAGPEVADQPGGRLIGRALGRATWRSARARSSPCVTKARLGAGSKRGAWPTPETPSPR